MFVLVYLVVLIAGIVGVIAFGIQEGMTAGAVFLRVTGLVIGAQVLVVLAVAVMAGVQGRATGRPSGQSGQTITPVGRDERHWGTGAAAAKRSAAHGRQS